MGRKSKGGMGRKKHYSQDEQAAAGSGSIQKSAEHHISELKGGTKGRAQEVRVAFDEWGKERKAWLVLFAREAVGNVDYAVELLAMLRSEKNLRLGTIPKLDCWLKLYRDHGRVIDVMAEVLLPLGTWKRSGLGNPGSVWRWFSSDLREFSRATLAERKAWLDAQDPQQVQETSHAMSQLLGGMLKCQTRSLVPDDSENYLRSGRMERVMRSVEAAFFFRVAMPCWLLYCESVTRIYARARRADIRAIEQLLVIDKSIIFEPRIRDVVHWAAHQNSQQYAILSAALRSKIPKITRSRLKRNFAGLISRIAATGGEDLTAPQLRQLFDVGECVRTGMPGAQDPDFPDSSEGMTKLLQRYRPIWKDIPGANPDKISA